MSFYHHETGGAACPIFAKKGPRAVILCDGPPPQPDVLAYWLTGADLFICTDAAGHPYDQLPAPPDVVIGDFDALSGRLLAGRDGPMFLRVDEQETTDSEKAVLYALDQGLEEVVLLGAVGWRLDHTLYNTQLLERYADRLRLALAGQQADGVRLSPGQSFRGRSIRAPASVSSRWPGKAVASPSRGRIIPCWEVRSGRPDHRPSATPSPTTRC